MDAKMMNIMGLMQWGIILQFAVFFFTYAADLFAASSLSPPAAKSKKEDK